LDDYAPSIVTSVDSIGEVFASFAVKYSGSPELFWGFYREIPNNDSLAVGIDMDSSALTAAGFEHITRCDQWNNTPELYYQTITLPITVPQDPYFNLEVQVYQAGGKKGKGTLVSTSPIQPDKSDTDKHANHQNPSSGG
jgi:hypothetical protein